MLSAFAPLQGLFQQLKVFESNIQNFILFLLFCAVVAFILTGIFCFTCRKIRNKVRRGSKLGEILLSLELISQDELKKALKQQKLRLGERLVRSGHITPEQRDAALMIQKKNHAKLGEILKGLGYATEVDIRWALKTEEKKIGMILKEMGLITDHDIEYALNIKNTYRIDRKGKIVLVE